MKIRFSNKCIMIFLFLLPFFEPRAITMGKMHYIYIALRCIATAGMFILLINRKNAIMAGMQLGFCVSFCAYTVVSIFSMLYNGKLGYYDLLKLISNLVLTIFLTCYINTRELYMWFMKALFFLLNMVTGICIILQFVYADGFGTDATGNIVYFWNTRNHMVTLFLLTIVVNILYAYFFYGKIKIWQYFVIGAIALDIVYLWSATAVVCIILFLLLWIFVTVGIKPVVAFFSNPLMVLLTGFIANIAIVIFRIQNIFSWFIVNVLHRDITFSYRTYIWDSALVKIRHRLWLGYGEDDIITYKFSSTKILDVIPHNEFLDIVVLYGILALLSLLVILFLLCSQLEKYKYTYSAKILTITFFVLLLCCITEKISPNEPVYLLYALVWIVPIYEGFGSDMQDIIKVKKHNHLIVKFFE